MHLHWIGFWSGWDGDVDLGYMNDEGTYYTEIWGRYHWSDRFFQSDGEGDSAIKAAGF